MDRVDEPAEASLVLEFEGGVVSLVPGSISPAGVYAIGSGVIVWPTRPFPPGTSPFSAQFQWIDFRVESTTFDAAAVATVPVEQPLPLTVMRPQSARGLKIEENRE